MKKIPIFLSIFFLYILKHDLINKRATHTHTQTHSEDEPQITSIDIQLPFLYVHIVFFVCQPKLLFKPIEKHFMSKDKNALKLKTELDYLSYS